MTKKLPPEKKKKAGRKSLYNPEFHPKKVNELALMGLTDAQMAASIGISEATFNQWKLDHPAFSEPLKRDKLQADAPVVKSLYQRALGYKITEKKVVQMPDGSTRKEVTEKEVPPDVTAQIFWLKNRQPKDWRDKRDMELTGKDGQPLNPKSMSDDELITAILEAHKKEAGVKRKNNGKPTATSK